MHSVRSKSFLMVALLLTAILNAGVSTCEFKGEELPGPDAGDLGDAKPGISVVHLSPEDLAEFDAMEGQTLHFDNVVLPNGKTIAQFAQEITVPGKSDFWDDQRLRPDWTGRSEIESHMASFQNAFSTKKNYLIARLVGRALELTQRPRYQYSSDGYDAPAQNGLAYVFPSLDYVERASSSEFEASCTERLYGVDSMGFIRHTFAFSDIDLDQKYEPGLISQSLHDTALSEERMNNWDVEFELIPTNYNTAQTGDILDLGDHMGIVVRDQNGVGYLLQSHGSPLPDYDCRKNYSQSRGPRAVLLSDVAQAMPAINHQFRLKSTIDGTWQVSMRCQGASEDAYSAVVSLDTDRDDSFEIDQAGFEPDGSAYYIRLQGNYDVESGQVTGEYHAWGDGEFGQGLPPQRTDTYSLYPSNSSGYFPTNQVFPADGSLCYTEMRWANVAQAAAKKIEKKIKDEQTKTAKKKRGSVNFKSKKYSSKNGKAFLQ